MWLDGSGAEALPLDIIVEVSGDRVKAELAVENNPTVRLGDMYTATWEDGTISVLRVLDFDSAQKYGNTLARRTEAMREAGIGAPVTRTAKKAYQVKLVVLRVEGEIQPDGKRRIGPSRMPDVMVPIERISDETLERFAVSAEGNMIVGNLHSGSKTLRRLARIEHNYAGQRMLVLGRPGMGKSQLIRAILSQAMAIDEVEGDD